MPTDSVSEGLFIAKLCPPAALARPTPGWRRRWWYHFPFLLWSNYRPSWQSTKHWAACWNASFMRPSSRPGKGFHKSRQKRSSRLYCRKSN